MHQTAFIVQFSIVTTTRRDRHQNPPFLLFQGVLVGHVTAKDADEGGKAALTYSFIKVEPEKGRELFNIEDEHATIRGKITVKKDLTNEWGEYRVTVMVSRHCA
jgi:hypothetical protein